MAFIQPNKLPHYFYSCTHPLRWRDPYADDFNNDRMVLLPYEVIDMGRRNTAYNYYMGKFGLPGRNCKFQVIQVLNFHHSCANPKRDWWGRYLDCLFRVFVMPYTKYECTVKQHYQWYILCPEDTETLLRYEYDQKGVYIPKRDPILEKYVPLDKRLRKIRMLPVEACRHWRHETTAGRLPEGL